MGKAGRTRSSASGQRVCDLPIPCGHWPLYRASRGFEPLAYHYRWNEEALLRGSFGDGADHRVRLAAVHRIEDGDLSELCLLQIGRQDGHLQLGAAHKGRWSVFAV